MTPLANTYLRWLTTPIKNRAPLNNPDGVDVWASLYGARCFEVTEVVPLINELNSAMKKDQDSGMTKGVVETYAFLPAEKTWIESRSEKGKREAILLADVGGGKADMTLFTEGICAKVASLNLNEFLNYDSVFAPSEGEVNLIAFTYQALAIINTPRIVAQQEHAPNKGIQKRLNAARQITPFKLLPWSEIKLEVTGAGSDKGSDGSENALTGKRALHFCRAHIRVKRGRIEYVSSHWRGDPAIGIRQSDYKIK